MNINELKERLTKDLTLLKLPINEVKLCMRPYSTTYYGRYYPVYDDKRVEPKIYIYPFKSKSGVIYPYYEVLCTTIHEMVHHIQHSSSDFVRIKGVMHDPNFWKLYNHYINRLEKLDILKEEDYEEQSITS